MWRYLALRVVQAAITVYLVLTVVFVIARIAGDPVIFMVNVSQTTNEQLQELRHQLGLDAPLPAQYVRYLTDSLHGDLGRSFRTNQPALKEVLSRVPASLELGAFSLAVTLLVSIPLGVLAAVTRGSVIDVGARTVALAGQAAPNFWVGLLLIFLFSVRLGWFPTGGQGGFKHLVLPGVTLGASTAAALTRLTRSSMLDVLDSDYLTTARSKGLPRRIVIFKHAFRNAMIPVVTILGLRIGTLVSGAVIIETIFSWPGVGRLVITSISNSDFPVVQAAILLTSAAVVLANLLTDVSYMFIDPRIRFVRS